MGNFLSDPSEERFSGDFGCIILTSYALFLLMLFLLPHKVKWLSLMVPGLILGFYLLWLILVFIGDTISGFSEAKAQGRHIPMSEVVRHFGRFATSICLLLVIFTPMALAVVLWR